MPKVVGNVTDIKQILVSNDKFQTSTLNIQEVPWVCRAQKNVAEKQKSWRFKCLSHCLSYLGEKKLNGEKLGRREGTHLNKSQHPILH